MYRNRAVTAKEAAVITRRGKFIVIEGLDGSGKSTQIFRLRKEIETMGIRTASMREPTEGVIGSLIRDALKKRIVFSQETMAHLFAADRAEHINKRLLPELSEGTVCLCDRFVFSNLAFQGTSLPMERVRNFNQHAIDTLMPDLTVFIDTSPEVCARRIHAGRQHSELFEQTDIMQKVRENYTQAFKMFPDQAVCRIDGDLAEDEVFAEIWKNVEKVIGFLCERR